MSRTKNSDVDLTKFIIKQEKNQVPIYHSKLSNSEFFEDQNVLIPVSQYIKDFIIKQFANL